MNSRTMLTICVGVLLPLPLVLLLRTLLLSGIGPETLAGTRIIPVLDSDHRARLMTYRRRCGSTEQCDPPLGCVREARHGMGVCTDSQCTVDQDCPVGLRCGKVPTEDSGLLVRACIAMGVRREGEYCYRFPADQRSACAEGLLCAGREGWCARSCRLGQQGQCPEGFFCADTRPEPACLPTCEKRGCPTGQHCIQFEEGASTCVHVYGVNCQQTPCPGEQWCDMRFEPMHPGKAWLGCTGWCREDSPLCPSGMSCGEYFCTQACDPKGSLVCAEGYRCEPGKKDGAFGCQPDW
jgi:hypothetical protein